MFHVFHGTGTTGTDLVYPLRVCRPVIFPNLEASGASEESADSPGDFFDRDRPPGLRKACVFSKRINKARKHMTFVEIYDDI